MFTGIIKEIGKIESVQPLKNAREVVVSCDLAQYLQVDQSICIDGACHTVIEARNSTFTVQSVKETLKKTTIGSLEKGDWVNLEPSLRANQPMDGHIVQGHVDCTGEIESVYQKKNDLLFKVSFPDKFGDLIVPRGSITLNGISLTVAKIEGTSFTIAVIPYTSDHTTMHSLQTGDKVNLEFDILGKYVINHMKQ